MTRHKETGLCWLIMQETKRKMEASSVAARVKVRQIDALLERCR